MFAAMSKGNKFMINNIYLYVYQDDGDIFNRLKIIDFKLFFITLHPSIHLFPRVLFTAVLQLIQYLFVCPVCFRRVE